MPGGCDLPADYGECSHFNANIQCSMMIVLLHTMSMTSLRGIQCIMSKNDVILCTTSLYYAIQ